MPQGTHETLPEEIETPISKVNVRFAGRSLRIALCYGESGPQFCQIRVILNNFCLGLPGYETTPEEKEEREMHQNDWDSWDDELLIREVDYADILDNLFWLSNEEIFFLRLMASGLNLGNYSLVMV